ncbi:hypothetical protein M514_00321 [Trichuris suis]|uniref:Uncharacterized protein n=1 Tax=Trichuris suis TaxID=68888 RepID=A0A085NGJ8_9BILA|nr:hypothetical protein M513_00321 [Trichuris suis]KFD68594.1 hypothetical protein M514_00321 [Trichuris suis]
MSVKIALTVQTFLLSRIKLFQTATTKYCALSKHERLKIAKIGNLRRRERISFSMCSYCWMIIFDLLVACSDSLKITFRKQYACRIRVLHSLTQAIKTLEEIHFFAFRVNLVVKTVKVIACYLIHAPVEGVLKSNSIIGVHNPFTFLSVNFKIYGASMLLLFQFVCQISQWN